MEWREPQDHKSVLIIHGSVMDVLEGAVSEKNLSALAKGTFDYALGAGTFTTKERVGETIVIQGQPSVFWQEAERSFVKTEDTVKSPFLMGIRKEKASALFTIKEEIALDTLYNQLSKKYPSAFAVAGQARFKKLDSTFVKKPPIFYENINEKAASYWHEKIEDSMVLAFVFAVVISNPLAFDKKALSTGFYQNPHEKQTGLLSHTHGALKEPSMAHFKAVRHILTSSVLEEASFELFSLSSIKKLSSG